VGTRRTPKKSPEAMTRGVRLVTMGASVVEYGSAHLRSACGEGP
jgi:hypothetical protein